MFFICEDCLLVLLRKLDCLVNSENSLRWEERRQARAGLPAASVRKQFTALDEQVIVITGETGSGKTTQLPQFLLEHAAEREQDCSILCTQPRRLAAMSIAERVAFERGESVGGTIGYAVRSAES